jgi:hypothetical protein
MTINAIQKTITQMQEDLKEAGPTQLFCFGALVSSIALGSIAACNRSNFSFAFCLGISYLSYNTFQVLTNLNNLQNNPINLGFIRATYEAAKEKTESQGFSGLVGRIGSTEIAGDILSKFLQKNTVFFEFGASAAAKAYLNSGENPIIAIDDGLIELVEDVQDVFTTYLSKLNLL